MKLITMMVLSLTFGAIACDIDGKTGFAPQNDLNIPSSVKSINGIDKEEFMKVIDEVVKVYKPIIEKNGDKLTMNKLWDNGTVNASAQRQGSNVIINMYGGLARHSLVTRDGFAIVLCHELGHHLGGAPKIKRFFSTTWASNEGQSDYFATLKCFRKVYLDDDNASIVAKLDVHPMIEQKCNSIYKSEAEVNLCIRSIVAAQSTTNLLASLGKQDMPKVDTPDTSEVSKTNHKHPKAQCRLDTYFAGALCDRPLAQELSDKDANIGTCNRKNNDTQGLRSRCWYQPKKSIW
ncbi:MAG: hypothetical protein N4A33_11650 [Bacteriovoracaceae bacterium]|jgi:hypothetical protein|nr:hypothetical protein [Bacteriovoracaceae bacterium]